MLVSNVGSAETLPQKAVVWTRHYMDTLNLNCLKQDPTTTWNCGRLINSLYCISTFAINVYNIWPLPVHDTLLHHIDLYFIWCNQCPLHTAPQFIGQCWRLDTFICRVRLAIHIIVSSNSLMRKSLNSPSDVSPSISFRENIVHLVCSKHWNTPSHNLCGSCDLASKLNYVTGCTGDELDTDVSIALFRNQSILRYAAVVLFVWLFLIYMPSYRSGDCSSKPIHKLYYLGKKSSSIFWVSNNASWKIDIMPVISAWNWNFSLVRSRHCFQTTNVWGRGRVTHCDVGKCGWRWTLPILYNT